MPILLDSDHSDIKTRLCTTDENNHLHINQTATGFLSGFVPVSIHHVPYPGTGESENKITSAYDEALKTVGYGRLEKPCTIYYNNPFDPRLTFNGLGHLLAVTDAEAVSMSKEQLTQNVFLALENPNFVMDDFFNQSRTFYQALCSTTDLDLNVDPNRYKLFPEVDGNVSDDGSEDCKRIFSKISSLPVKSIWADIQRTTESGTTDLKPDQTIEKTDTAKEKYQYRIKETLSKDNEDQDPSHINKIRYSYQRLVGKNKSSIEPARNTSTSPEEASTYGHFEREIEQVVSEESDPEDNEVIPDSMDTPTQLIGGDQGTGDGVTTTKPEIDSSQPKCPKQVIQTGEEMTVEPALPTHYFGEPDVSTAESRQGLNLVPPDPCRNDCDPTTTATEVGPAHDAIAAAKIQEFKQEMERIIAGRDVPKSSQMDVPYSERSVESIVAKSVLRPSVPSFYPGFNKAGTADHGNDHVIDGKTSTNNHTTRPPPGITHQYRSQGHPNWAHIQYTAGHIPTGNFQTHHAVSRTDHGQKTFDFRSTLTNPRTCNQPPAMNKLQMQPTQAAAAALIMANCLQQPSRRDVTCNPQPTPQNKPYNDCQPPPRFQQYQQQYGHIGVQNPYHGNTARNPPPGFNETPQAPIRNRDHAAFQSEQVHQQHPLPIQQPLTFRFSTEQSFQNPQQQPTTTTRFPPPQVQNVHQHQLVQQQQHNHQQQNQHPHNQQHQQQYRPQQQPHRLPHQPHPPLHPLQPQPHFLNPEVPPFQYFNKIQNGSQQPTINMRAGWHLNIQTENANCNNGNVDLCKESSTPLITLNSSRLEEDPKLNVSVTDDHGVNVAITDAPTESVRVKGMSASAESIPSLVKGDYNRESSKDKHKISKFRSRRTNLVRIYPSKDCS